MENIYTNKIGRVSEVQKGLFYVIYSHKEYKAVLKGSLLAKDEAPIVGDYVSFEFIDDEEVLILDILKRKTLLKRPDQSGHSIGYVKNMQEQLLVANFDYVFIITALNDDYSFNRIARYVSAVISGGGTPVVVLTKADLVNDINPYVKEVKNLSKDIIVHAVSSFTAYGVDELSFYFKNGKTIALVGSSGAGKSTLINTILGKEVMKTSEIRESDSKGRHTTTYRKLIELENGASIIDTPGMREFGVMDAGKGLSETFEDIEALALNCKFTNCQHNKEAGCALRQAVKEGRLSEKRLNLYLRLSIESNKNEKMKVIARKRKILNNQKKNRYE